MAEIILNNLRSRGETASAGEFSLTLESGKIHSLVSVADCGKSMLARALAGTEIFATLQVTFAAGREFAPQTPADALRNGIATLFPRPLIFDNLSVLENLGITSSYSAGRLRKEILPLAREMWAKIADGEFPENIQGGELAPAAARRLEIIRALVAHPRLLVLNEALNAFTGAEKRRIFALLREQPELTVIFTTANSAEAAEFADVCHVHPTHFAPGDDDEPTKFVPASGCEEIARLLYGENSGAAPLRNGKTILEILGLKFSARAADISLTLRQGEILGITGLAGAGWEKLAGFFTGRTVADKGVLTVNGKNLRARQATAKKLRAAGIAVFAGREMEKFGLSPRAALKDIFAQEREMAEFVKTDSPVLVVTGLEISGASGAAEIFRAHLPELVAAGRAVIVISPNAEELLRYANTLAVFHNGALCPARAAEKWTREEVTLFAEKGAGGMMSLL